MAYTKTTWQDRLVEYPNRYAKSGETGTSVTLTADPGTVTQAGTPISAANLNKIEQGIADAHNGQLFKLTADDGTGKGGGFTGDVNTIVKAGFYSIGNTATNTPVASSYGFLIVVQRSAIIAAQIWVASSTTNADIYTRVTGDTGTTWGVWKQFARTDSPTFTNLSQLLFANGSKIYETAGQRMAINAEANRFDVVTEDGINYIITARYDTDLFQFKGSDVYHSGFKPDATGSYTGNGATGRTITLPFTPSYVIVSPNEAVVQGCIIQGGTIYGPDGSTVVASLSGTTLTVTYGSGTQGNSLNTSGKTYTYIAFR